MNRITRLGVALYARICYAHARLFMMLNPKVAEAPAARTWMSDAEFLAYLDSLDDFRCDDGYPCEVRGGAGVDARGLQTECPETLTYPREYPAYEELYAGPTADPGSEED